MRAKLILVRVGIWAAVSLASIAGLSSAFAQTVAVAVVVNEKNPVTNLSIQELRKLFAGEKHAWAGGLPVKIFVRAPNTRERAVLLRLLSVSESEYKKYWTAQVFRGEAQAEPITLPSNGMQKEALAAFPGAVALVSFQDVKPGMKVVKVDGHLPGESGYPLN
jgi:phosphate transport system substrate-binding protein